MRPVTVFMSERDSSGTRPRRDQGGTREAIPVDRGRHRRGDATAITASAAAGQSSGGTKEALTATDVGITPTEIRIGVIADTGSSLAPGLFQGSVDAVQAWAKYMNEKEGGLAGRKIVVDTYDSGLDAEQGPQRDHRGLQQGLRHRRHVGAVPQQHRRSGRMQGFKGAATGLPDFPFTQTEVLHQCSPVSYSINPPVLDCATKDQHPQTYRGALGATDYYLKKFGKNALHGLFLYPSDLKSAKNSQVPAFTAQQQAGIKQDATLRRVGPGAAVRRTRRSSRR